MVCDNVCEYFLNVDVWWVPLVCRACDMQRGPLRLSLKKGGPGSVENGLLLCQLLLPPLHRQRAMALQLCADEWLLISDFLQSASLSQVCRTTWCLLQWRHVTCQANFSSAEEWAAAQKDGMMQPLANLKNVLCRRMNFKSSPQPLHIDGLQLLSRLSSEAALHTLTLRCSNMKPGSAQALAALKHAPSLWSLTLILPDNNIGDSGAQALAELKEAPALTTLTLDLEGNGIGDAGAQALATLKDAASLSTLKLNLRRNRIRASGAEALAQLPGAPSLQTLILASESAAPLPAPNHRASHRPSHRASYRPSHAPGRGTTTALRPQSSHQRGHGLGQSPGRTPGRGPSQAPHHHSSTRSSYRTGHRPSSQSSGARGGPSPIQGAAQLGRSLCEGLLQRG